MNKAKKGMLSILMITLLTVTVGIVGAFFVNRDKGWPQDVYVVSLSLSLNGNKEYNHIDSTEEHMQIGSEKPMNIEITNESVYPTEFTVTFDLVNSDETVETPDGLTTYPGSPSNNLLAMAIEVYDGEGRFVSMLDDFSRTPLTGSIAPGQTLNYNYTLKYSYGASSYYSDKDFVLQLICDGVIISDFTNHEKYYVSDYKTLFKLQTEKELLYNKQIVLMSDILLEDDLIFPSNVGLDLNGHKLNLNNHKFEFNLDADSEQEFVAQELCDSSNGNASVVNGNIVINSTKGFLKINDTMDKFSSNIVLQSFNFDTMVETIRKIYQDYSAITNNGQFDFFDDIRYYLDNNIIDISLNPEQISEYNITVNEDLSFTVPARENTFIDNIKLHLQSGSNVDVIDDVSIRVIGTSSQSIAENLLNSIPNDIYGSMFFRKYMIENNAHITWISSNNDIIDHEGIFLRNGYQNISNFDQETIELAIIVEVDNKQFYTSKEVTVHIFDKEQKTELINITDTITFNNIDETYNLYDKIQEQYGDLFNRVGCTDVKYTISSIPGNNVYGASEFYLEVSADGHQLTVLNRPLTSTSATVYVDVTFTYDNGDVVEIKEKPFYIIGFNDTQELINPTNELIEYLPKDTLNPEFLMPTVSKYGYNVEYTIDPKYSEYLKVTDYVDDDNVAWKKFTIVPIKVPNVDTKILFNATLTSIADPDVSYVADLSFNIDGIYHDTRDILDFNLYAQLLKEYDANNDGWLTRTELKVERTTELNLSSKDITNIKGLEALTGTTKITLDGNSIIDLDPLTEMYQLTYLKLSNNSIASVEALQYLDNLTELYLDHNPITDISSIQYLQSIKKLDVNNIKATDFAALANLSSLTQAYVYGNEGATNDANSYYYNLLLSNNSSIKVYAASSSSAYSYNATNVAQSVILEKVKRIYETQNTLYVPNTYIYNGTTYYLKWNSHSTDVISFAADNTYTFVSNIIVDTMVKIGVKIGTSASAAATAKNEKVFDLMLKKGDVSKSVYLQLEEGAQPVDATDLITDNMLLQLLFDPQKGVNKNNSTSEFVYSSFYTEDITISYEELHPSVLLSINWVDEPIFDLTGLSYFKDAISAMYFGNNKFTDLTELGEMHKLTHIQLNGALYNFDPLKNITTLVDLNVYGSFALNTVEVETALYHVYKANPGIKIHKDSVTSNWNPYLIPVTKKLESLNSTFYVRYYKDVVGLEREARVRMYDDEEDTVFLISSISKVSGQYGSYFTVNNSLGTLTYSKLWAYPGVAYSTIEYKVNAGGQDIVVSKVVEIIVEVVDNIYFVEDLKNIQNEKNITAMFPGKVLRQKVLDTISSKINNATSSSYSSNIIKITNGDKTSYYINQNLLNTISGNLSITGGNSDETYFLNGLEYLKNIKTLSLSYFSKGNADTHNHLVNITKLTISGGVTDLSWLIDDEDPINGNYCKNLQNLLVTGSSYINFYTKFQKDNGDYISVFKYLPNLTSIEMYNGTIYSFRPFLDFESVPGVPYSNNLSTLKIYGNPGSKYGITYDILELLYNNSSASTKKFYTDSNSTLFSPSTSAEQIEADIQATWDDCKTTIVDLGVEINDVNYNNYNHKYLINSTDVISLPSQYLLFSKIVDGVETEYLYNITWSIKNNVTTSGNMLEIADEKLKINYNLPIDWYFVLVGTVNGVESNVTIEYQFNLKGSNPYINEGNNVYQSVSSNYTINYVNVYGNSRTLTITPTDKCYSLSNIDDSILRGYIAGNVLGCGTIFNRKSITDFSISRIPVISLKGMDLFNYSGMFSVTSSYITDLTYITGTNITDLDMSYNGIEDVSHLLNFTNLTSVSFVDNNINTIYDANGCYLRNSFSTLTSLNLEGNYFISHDDIDSLVVYESGTYVGPKLTNLNLIRTSEVYSIAMVKSLRNLYAGIMSVEPTLQTTLSLIEELANSVYSPVSLNMSVTDLYNLLNNIVNVYESQIKTQCESGLDGTSFSEKLLMGQFTGSNYAYEILSNELITSINPNDGSVTFYSNTYAGVFKAQIRVQFVTGLKCDFDYVVKYGLSDDVGTTSALRVKLSDGTLIRLVRGVGTAINEPYMFEDYRLASYLIKDASITNNVIDISVFTKVTSLYLNKISSLKGLEYLTNLTTLSLTNCTFEEFPVLNNSKITSLTINNNQYFTDVTNIGLCNSLNTLNLRYCKNIVWDDNAKQVIGKFNYNSLTLSTPFNEIYYSDENKSFGDIKLGNSLFNGTSTKKVEQINTLNIFYADYNNVESSTSRPTLYENYNLSREFEKIKLLNNSFSTDISKSYYIASNISDMVYRNVSISNNFVITTLAFSSNDSNRILDNTIVAGEIKKMPSHLTYHNFDLELDYKAYDNNYSTELIVPTTYTGTDINVSFRVSLLTENGTTIGKNIYLYSYSFTVKTNNEKYSPFIMDGGFYNPETGKVDFIELQIQIEKDGPLLRASDYFEDHGFMGLIYSNKNYNTDKNTILTYEELGLITNLTLNSYQINSNGISDGTSSYIHSLEGLGLFYNLKSLTITKSNFGDLNGLYGLEGLEKFEYSNLPGGTSQTVYLKDWSFLDSSINTLKEFSLSLNGIDIQDLSFLQKFPNLQKVRISSVDNSNNTLYYWKTSSFQSFAAWMSINRPNCQIYVDNSSKVQELYNPREDYKRAMNIFSRYQSTSSINIVSCAELQFVSGRSGYLATSINYGGEIYDVSFISCSANITVNDDGYVEYIQDVDNLIGHGYVLASIEVEGITYYKMLNIQLKI